MENLELALRNLLTKDLPLDKAGPHLRHAVKRALAVGNSAQMLSATRTLVADLIRRNVLLRVAVEGQGGLDMSYCMVKDTNRLVNLAFLGEEHGVASFHPTTSDAAPFSEDPSHESRGGSSLSEFAGMLGAMEHAQDLEIGFPQSGETGVILSSILRLLARFTPQFDLYVLLFEDEILPEDPHRIFTVTSTDLASGWMAVRQPLHSAWIPSPAELPGFIQNHAAQHPSRGQLSSAVAVPLMEPGDVEANPESGCELGLLFLVAHEDWDRSPLLRLAKRLSRFVTRRWQHQREVNQRIHTDSLTKVYNRAFFDSQFTLELERARRSEQPLSLVICDLDHFKSINDRYLHHNGDRVLKMVARRLREELRRIDHVCRIGGEEFALILPDTSHESALEVMDRLVKAPFLEEIIHQGEIIDVSVTFSFGAITFPEAGTDAFELYRKADAMLFLSKDLGRNQCHFWSSEGDHIQLLPNASAD